MCEPVTIGLAIVGVVGALQQGQAAKSAAKSDAKIANHNAVLANRKAEDARTRGAQEGRAKQIQTMQLLGLQRAAAAGAGVQVDSGSALKLTEDTAMFGKLDELTIRNNAERQALGFEGQASIFGAEAEAAKAAGSAAETASFINAGSSLLGSANASGITGNELFGGGGKPALTTKKVQGFGNPNPRSSARGGFGRGFD